MEDKIVRFRKFLRVPDRGDHSFLCRIIPPEERGEIHDFLTGTYREMGFWDDEGEEDRLFYHRKDETVCFAVEMDGRLAGTVSVFPDGEDGLPLDSVFSEEMKTFRAQKRKFVEIGALVAGDKHPFILHSLYKLVHNISLFYFGADDLFLTINPKHRTFYQALFCMEEIGESKALPSVGGAPATLLRMDLRTAGDNMKKAFPREPAERDCYRFYYEDRPDGFPAEIFEAERKEDLQNV